ncbi:MAG: hypothetical protein FJ144_23975 [Deltaproteobacteria bacterium]|nr:hypothetical protein [Deltaproteobacteria bacterium]
MRFTLPRLVLRAAALLVAIPALSASAGTHVASPLDHRVLERTWLVPAAGTITAYEVPENARVVLTRFCGGSCVSCSGKKLGGKAFRTNKSGCVEHQPGILLPPGETVQCTNRCATMNAALFSGVLQH